MQWLLACMMTVNGHITPCEEVGPGISETYTSGGAKIINVGPGEGDVSYDREGGCSYRVVGGYRRLVQCDNRIVVYGE